MIEKKKQCCFDNSSYFENEDLTDYNGSHRAHNSDLLEKKCLLIQIERSKRSSKTSTKLNVTKMLPEIRMKYEVFCIEIP